MEIISDHMEREKRFRYLFKNYFRSATNFSLEHHQRAKGVAFF